MTRKSKRGRPREFGRRARITVRMNVGFVSLVKNTAKSVGAPNLNAFVVDALEYAMEMRARKGEM